MMSSEHCLAPWYIYGTLVHVSYCGTCVVLWFMFGFGLMLFVLYGGACLVLWYKCLIITQLLTHFPSTDLFSAMFVDSKIAKNIVVGRSKLKYEINKGINPYLLEVRCHFLFFIYLSFSSEFEETIS